MSDFIVANISCPRLTLPSLWRTAVAHFEERLPRCVVTYQLRHMILRPSEFVEWAASPPRNLQPMEIQIPTVVVRLPTEALGDRERTFAGSGEALGPYAKFFRCQVLSASDRVLIPLAWKPTVLIPGPTFAGPGVSLQTVSHTRLSRLIHAKWAQGYYY